MDQHITGRRVPVGWGWRNPLHGPDCIELINPVPIDSLWCRPTPGLRNGDVLVATVEDPQNQNLVQEEYIYWNGVALRRDVWDRGDVRMEQEIVEEAVEYLMDGLAEESDKNEESDDEFEWDSLEEIKEDVIDHVP